MLQTCSSRALTISCRGGSHSLLRPRCSTGLGSQKNKRYRTQKAQHCENLAISMRVSCGPVWVRPGPATASLLVTNSFKLRYGTPSANFSDAALLDVRLAARCSPLPFAQYTSRMYRSASLRSSIRFAVSTVSPGGAPATTMSVSACEMSGTGHVGPQR